MATQNVSPLVYSQLRMLAEASVGIRSGESATFVFDAAGTNRSPTTNILGPQVVPPGAPWPEQGVLVKASNQGKLTDPEGGVVVQVAGASGPGVNAVDYQADALFWSDAAVQKFVLPYYASCMGYEAYRQLAVLEEAWSGSHAGVTVVALMHVTGTPAGPSGEVGPMEPLWIVYLQESDNTVRAQSLADFSRANPATLPPLERPAPRPYVAPPSDVAAPYPDYTTLRSMAEWAASLDTEPMYFVYDPQKRQFGKPTARVDADGGAIVVPVFNPFVSASRVKPSRVVFAGHDLAADCDAVFWSTGAIEQFMLPYYASIDGFAGLDDLRAIREAWTKNVPLVGGNLLEDGNEVQYREEDECGTIIGFFHIWLSMEIPIVEGGGTAARREIGALHADASGVARTSRFSAGAAEAAGAA